MKRCFYLLGVMGFVLILSLAFVGCENPTSSGSGSDANGPADGTPVVFENQSSYVITVSPSEGYLDQGWKSFSLPVGQSKTIRLDKKYTTIYYTYNNADVVKLQWVSGNKGIFTNK
jgi:hypothetical protein